MKRTKMILNYKDYIKESNNNLFNKLKPYLIESKYLYHYTLSDNLDSILEEGLIPRKNSNYSKGSTAVFLTNSESLYKSNLPQDLMDFMNDYYENPDNYDNKPIVQLKVIVDNLDITKFTWDDDYILNKYGWNKAKTDIDKIVESLDIWGSIAYLDIIPKENIISQSYNYGN